MLKSIILKLSPLASEADDWKNAVTYAEKETKERILESDPGSIEKDIYTRAL